MVLGFGAKSPGLKEYIWKEKQLPIYFSNVLSWRMTKMALREHAKSET